MQGTEIIYDNKRYCIGRVGRHGRLKKGEVLWMRARGTENFVKCIVHRAAQFDTISSMTDRQRIVLAQFNDPSKKYSLGKHTRSIYAGAATRAALAVFNSPSDQRFRVLQEVTFWREI